MEYQEITPEMRKHRRSVMLKGTAILVVVGLCALSCPAMLVYAMIK